jgi:hypothetical protein
MKKENAANACLFVAGFAAAIAIIVAISMHYKICNNGHFTFFFDSQKHNLTPWRCVGGCGESSGSVSSDLQLKWIGKGVSGALIDMDATFSQSILADTAKDPTQNFDGALRLKTTALLVNIYYHPRILDFKLALPFLIKEGYGQMTGPFGDMSLDMSRAWGVAGNFRTALVAVFPTGRYDIPEQIDQTLRPELQLGSGVFGASARAQYTIDRDWGLITVGTSYSAGLFAMLTKDYDYDKTLNKVVSSKKSFQSARDGWGSVNDAGLINPDYVNIFTDFGIKTGELTHGLALSFSQPLRTGIQEDRTKEVTGWSGTDAASSPYFPTKSIAQQYADTLSSMSGTGKQYEHPYVVGTTKTGNWVVVDHIQKPRRTLPGLSLQYSIEKGDMVFPILVGGNVRVEFDKGIRFAAFTGGLGVKFPVY